jgi:hypothetical protein
MHGVDIAELRSYLKIDKHALDVELEDHSVLLFKISEAFVEAAAHRDMLKEHLATTDAELDSVVRKKKVDGRLTNDMVAACIQTHPRHEEASTAYLDAKKEADLLFALKEAFQSRGYMIRDLCSLFTANYFEEASVKPTRDTGRTTYMAARAKRGTRE